MRLAKMRQAGEGVLLSPERAVGRQMARIRPEVY